jgi:hypothetical protein
MSANAQVHQTPSEAEQSAGTLMTMNEAIARFHGEWVLMKVTEYDADHWPSKGYVIAHSPKREGISEALALEPPRGLLPPDAPRLRYYVFLAYPRVRSGPEYRAAAAKLFSDLVTAFAIHGPVDDRAES